MVPELPSDAPAPGAANVAGEASTPRVAAIEPSATPTPTAPPVDPDVPVFPDFATLLAGTVKTWADYRARTAPPGTPPLPDSASRLGEKGRLGSAPDLTGYGSREWLVGIISNPAHKRFYGAKNDRMPLYAEFPDQPAKNMLSKESIEILADWLRGEWR